MTAFISCAVSTAAFTVLQVWMFTKVFDVQRHRKAVVLATIVYTVFFLVIEYMLGTEISEDPTAAGTIARNLWHAVYTFVIIAFMGMFAEGSFFRNFAKLFIYYDVVTIVTGWLIIQPALMAVFDVEAEDLTYIYCGQETMVPAMLYMVIQVPIIMVLSHFFDRYLEKVLRKVPETAFKVVMIAAFGLYVVSMISMVLDPEIYRENNPYAYFIALLAIGSATLLVMLVKLANSTRLYGRMLYLESAMQYRRYETVMSVYRRVREFRHDLLNHITVFRNLSSYDDEEKRLSYEKQLQEFYDSVDDEIAGRNAWRKIDVDRLSARERYEVYEYLSASAERTGLSVDDVMIEADGSSVSAYMETSAPVRKVAARDSFRMMEVIAHFSHMKAEWTRDDRGLCFRMGPERKDG